MGERASAVVTLLFTDLVASTEKGEVRNDYGGSVKMDTEGRTQTMRSSVGGGPSVQVSTARGTVTVRKE